MEKFVTVSATSSDYEKDAKNSIRGFVNYKSNNKFEKWDDVLELESLSGFKGGLVIGREYTCTKGLRVDKVKGTENEFMMQALKGGKEISLSALLDTRSYVSTPVMVGYKKGKQKDTRPVVPNVQPLTAGYQAPAFKELIDALAGNPESVSFIYRGHGLFVWTAKTDGTDFNGESFEAGQTRCAPRHVCEFKPLETENPA